MADLPADALALLRFWFGDSPANVQQTWSAQKDLWFGKAAEQDAAVRTRFGELVQAALGEPLDAWDRTVRGRLAHVILLDQVPRNVFRGTARAFAGDAHALALAQSMLANGDDGALAPLERVFVYLPLEHAESAAMQERSVSLFQTLYDEAPNSDRALFDNFLDYARRHRDIVARFGRFPHRNVILGRPSSAEETQYLSQPGSGF